MTLHTNDIHHLPDRALSRSTNVDGRRLGPIAHEMRERATRQDPYVAPTESDYYAY